MASAATPLLKVDAPNRLHGVVRHSMRVVDQRQMQLSLRGQVSRMPLELRRRWIGSAPSLVVRATTAAVGTRGPTTVATRVS